MTLRIYGNRSLKSLPGIETRPTSGKVRQAVFNIWQGRINNCRWLDLCAGVGAIGAEALCRGAKEVIALELSAEACGVIRENWQKVISPEQRFQVLQGDVIKLLPRLQKYEKFDFIYFDPPYVSELYLPVLEVIAQYQLLTPEGELAVEHNAHLKALAGIECLQVCRQKSYGKTALTFYQLIT